MKTTFVFKKPSRYDDPQFENSHLQCFPEDWRQSFEESASVIAEQLEPMNRDQAVMELEYTNRKYRFLDEDTVEITLGGD